MASVRINVARGLLNSARVRRVLRIQRSRRTPPHDSSREMSPAPTHVISLHLAAPCSPDRRPPLLPPLRAPAHVWFSARVKPADECHPLVRLRSAPPLANRPCPLARLWLC